MRIGSWLALAGREFRGSTGRLVFFAACLSVGVAAVVAVDGFATALDSSIQGQARELLAADIAISSRRPISEEIFAAIESLPEAQTAKVRQLLSVVSVPIGNGDIDRPGPSLLCEIKAVEAGYPFYGLLDTQPVLPQAKILKGDRVLVGPELLARLDLSVGDTLRIGRVTATIAGTIVGEPDRMEGSFLFGPRVLMSVATLERSNLTGTGSRVRYGLLARLGDEATPEEVENAADIIRTVIPDPEFVEVDTYVEAQPALRNSLRRVERFLGLVALLSLLIGGIGVAQAVRAWLASRLDAIAVQRALGVRPREAFVLYLGQTAVLALIGSLFGAFAGALVARAAPWFIADLLSIQVDIGWQPLSMIRGIALGIGVAVIFGLRPLFDVLRVPPVRVLRRDADPLPVRRGIAVVLASILAAGVAVTATIQSGSIVRGVLFAVGLIAATAVLALGAWLVMKLVARAPRDFGAVALRHGLAGLGRPGAGTLGAVVALGLGVLTVLGMHLIQSRLSAQLDADLPTNAPTAFLIDIQPDQWEGVRQTLDDSGAEDLESVEVVMARLRSINGVAVSELVRPRDGDTADRRWVLTREQRLTSMEILPDDNVIIAGALWSDPDRQEVSIERDFAEDLGVVVGDTIEFDVQGVPLELLVSSIRTVEWGRFTINFFLVVEPGVLDEAPRYRVATVRLPEASEGAVQDRLAASYPNVTMLRLREVLEKIVAVLAQLGLGVRFLGAFTVLSGIAILAGAVSASAVRRRREVALYKTLGMTRAQVASVFAVEYALIGSVAGTIGTVGAIALAWAVVRYGFEIGWAWAPGVYALAILTTIVLSVIAGLATSARALAVRPLAILRQGD